MRRILVALLLISLLSPLPNSSAAKKLAASEAKAGAPCLIKGLTAATLEGPVICNKKWKLVPENKDSVETRAFRIVLREYLAQPEGALSLDLRIDPKTPSWGNRIKKGMEAGARLWGTSPAGSPTKVAYISADGEWIYNEANRDGFMEENRKEEIFRTDCQAGWNGNGDPSKSFWFYKYSENFCLTNVGFYQVPAHEYTHYAQDALSGYLWGRTPRVPWLDEGLASYIGAALGPMSDMRNDLRSMWVGQMRRGAKNLDFFSKGDESVYRSSNWQDVYAQGAIANEALVALIGISGVKSIYSSLSKSGTTYDSAFIANTGIGIDAWTSLLQGYIDSVKSYKPWSLAKLQSNYEAKKTA